MTLSLISMHLFKSGYAALVCLVFLGAFENSMPTLMDAWLIRSTKEISVYASVRSFASLAFASCSLLLGNLVGRWGYSTIPVLAVCILMVTIYLLLKIESHNSDHVIELWKPEPMKPRTLFSSWMVLALGFGFVLLPFGQILPLLVTGSNLSQGWIGIMTGMTSIFQFLSLRMYHKVDSLNDDLKVTIGLAAYVIGLFLCQNKSITSLLLSQVFFGSGYGILFPTLKGLIVKQSDDADTRQKLIISDLMIFSISPLLASIAFGWAINNLGIDGIIIGLVTILLATAALYLGQNIFKGGKKHGIKQTRN